MFRSKNKASKKIEKAEKEEKEEIKKDLGKKLNDAIELAGESLGNWKGAGKISSFVRKLIKELTSGLTKALNYGEFEVAFNGNTGSGNSDSEEYNEYQVKEVLKRVGEWLQKAESTGATADVDEIKLEECDRTWLYGIYKKHLREAKGYQGMYEKL